MELIGLGCFLTILCFALSCEVMALVKSLGLGRIGLYSTELYCKKCFCLQNNSFWCMAVCQHGSVNRNFAMDLYIFE